MGSMILSDRFLAWSWVAMNEEYSTRIQILHSFDFSGVLTLSEAG
jgi:hypothetical protein